MKLLWIGSFASEEILSKMPVKTIGQASGVTSQRSFINGIDQCIKDTETVLDTINVQGIPLYPTYPEKQYEETVWSRNGHSHDVSIGFDNSNRVNREISQRKALKDAADKWVSNIDSDEQVHIFLYEPVLCRLDAVKTIKKKHPRTKCTLIVPDIPEFVCKCNNGIKRALIQARKKAVDKKLKYIDNYVFYAKKMAVYYNVPAEKYTVIEGSLDSLDINKLVSSQTESNEFVLLYSGAITSGRGIPKFVDAFQQYADPDIKLWLTGAGDCDDYIHEMEKRDGRITHFGYLNMREDVLEKEAQATALLHIRDQYAESSSYCFPSKLFEYLASGKPVLSVKIPGIPDEYYEYLIEIKSLSPVDVANAINRVKNMTSDERDRFGKKARDFVLNNKSAVVQSRKLLDFALN